MVRGPNKSLKRLTAPHSWSLDMVRISVLQDEIKKICNRKNEYSRNPHYGESTAFETSIPNKKEIAQFLGLPYEDHPSSRNTRWREKYKQANKIQQKGNIREL
jgi:hypothetical protein